MGSYTSAKAVIPFPAGSPARDFMGHMLRFYDVGREVLVEQQWRSEWGPAPPNWGDAEAESALVAWAVAAGIPRDVAVRHVEVIRDTEGVAFELDEEDDEMVFEYVEGEHNGGAWEPCMESLHDAIVLHAPGTVIRYGWIDGGRSGVETIWRGGRHHVSSDDGGDKADPTPAGPADAMQRFRDSAEAVLADDLEGALADLAGRRGRTAHGGRAAVEAIREAKADAEAAKAVPGSAAP